MEAWIKSILTPEGLRDFGAGIVVGFSMFLIAVKRRWISVPDATREANDEEKDALVLKLTAENAAGAAREEAKDATIAALRAEIKMIEGVKP